MGSIENGNRRFTVRNLEINSCCAREVKFNCFKFKISYFTSIGQIRQLNEPIEVRITEWNTGGLLTRIEVCSV